MPSKPTPEQVVASARALVGTPWKHQGRNPEIGIDCVGLVVVVCRQHGIPIEDRERYRRFANGPEIIEIADKVARRIDKDEIRPGDALVMSMQGRGYPDHAGFVGEIDGRNTVIHSYVDVGRSRVIEHGIDAALMEKVIAAYRFTEDTE